MVAAAQSTIGILHYAEETIYKAQKAMIAAKFNGLVLQQQKVDPAKDHKKISQMGNPMTKVPFLETDAGCIASSNSIARYVARCRADTALYGKTLDEEAQIDTWMEFSIHELEVPLAVWLYPVLGVMEAQPAAATEEAKNDVKQALKLLNDHLAVSQFLIGSSVSLADVVVVCVLKEAFTRIFDPAFRAPYPKVCEWYESCCKMPQFSAVLGTSALCKTAEKPKPVQFPSLLKTAAPAKNKEAPKGASSAEGPATAAVAVSGDMEAQIKAVGDEIRTLKEKLKGEGVSGKKINDNEEIKALVAKLQSLKEGATSSTATPAKPAAQPAPSGGSADLEAKVKAVGDEIRVLKEKLKGEGLSGKKINDNEEIKALVAKLQTVKAEFEGGATSAPPAPKAVAQPAPAAGGSDIEAQVKAVGDEIRILKEKLKGEGLSGKKINDNEEIKALVAKLQTLKAQTA